MEVYFEGSIAEIRAQMHEFLASAPEATVAAPVEKVSKPRAVKTSTKDVETTVEPEPVAPKPATVAGPAVATVTAPAQNSLEEVKAAISPLVARIGKPAVIELLKKYGATKGSEVKSEQHAQFLAEVKGLVV